MRVSPWPARYGLDGCLFHPGQHRTVPGNGGSASAGWGLRDLKPGSCCAQDPHPHAHWGSGLAPPASGARAARGSDRLSVAGQGGRSQGGPGSGSEERLGVLQMEKDETVSDSSPHIANIGRLVEVSGAPGRWVTPLPGLHLMLCPRACSLVCWLPPLLLSPSSLAARGAALMVCPGLLSL